MMGILAFLRYLFEILGLIGREVHDAEERKAGSDANQVEAINAEINHVNRAADAGDKLPIDTPDPYDRDRK